MSELIHYGVLGMKWGIRKDGKPQGYQSNGRKRKGLTDKQKRYLKIGAGIAAGMLVTYGAYKLSQMSGFNTGTQAVETILTGDTGIVGVTKKGTAVHSIYESTSEALKSANPTGNRLNCPITSMTGLLRSHFHVNATAKACGKEGIPTPEMLSMVKECFPGCKTIPRTKDGAATAVKFGKSMADAEAMLRKNFGDNAKGIVGFQYKPNGFIDQGAGHVISWVIENGKARFYDFQTGVEKEPISWNVINPNGILQVARLDDALPDLDALEKYVDFA